MWDEYSARFDSSLYVYFHLTLFRNDVNVAMFHVSVFALFQLLSVFDCVVQGPNETAFQSD